MPEQQHEEPHLTRAQKKRRLSFFISTDKMSLLKTPGLLRPEISSSIVRDPWDVCQFVGSGEVGFLAQANY